MRYKYLLLIVAAIFYSNVELYATPIQWSDAVGGNGHWYEFVAIITSWDVAKQLAEEKQHNDFEGHLATITSFEEQSWISSVLPYNKVWLGGYQPDNTVEPDKGWAWITGEPWEYTNWRAGEPNDNYGDEDYLVIDKYSIDGQWNDQRIDGWNKMIGYIVEYEAESVPIPEPATMLLLGSGLAGLAGLRKKLRS